VYKILEAILVDDLQMRAEDISPTASCSGVGLDSLAVVELSSVLISRLGLEIHDYELLELATLGDIACLMEERRPATAAEPAKPHP
jgi:acyl carrier protein